MQIPDFFATLSAADKSALFAAGPIQYWIAGVYQSGDNDAADTIIRWVFRNGKDGTLAAVAYDLICTMDSDLIGSLIDLLEGTQIITTATASALRSVANQ